MRNFPTLQIHSAASFEYVFGFGLPMALAAYATIPAGGEISRVLRDILGEQTEFFWIVMGAAGMVGLIASIMFRPRNTAVKLVRPLLLIEGTALATVCGLWALYGVTAYLASPNFIGAAWGIAYVLAGVGRWVEIVIDLRKLDAARGALAAAGGGDGDR